jgi:hypothetical protein
MISNNSNCPLERGKLSHGTACCFRKFMVNHMSVSA